jgi:hydrogenase maturation protein HypF
MPDKGRIIIRGIVQGVGFRPFVYSRAITHKIKGTVLNLGSEVRIDAWGEKFEFFLRDVSQGTPLSVIDSVEVQPLIGPAPSAFTISRSQDGIRTGLIPPDVATCQDCVKDIFNPSGRYYGYFATSCVNCGPRYSIIKRLPYDRERTAMDEFPMCGGCSTEYKDPLCRRHHAQTIACSRCGPSLSLYASDGKIIPVDNPISYVAKCLDEGSIVAIKGIGGFHIACSGEMAPELKKRLGRTEQPFAIMSKKDWILHHAIVSQDEERILRSEVSPIVVLDKKDPLTLKDVSNLHTIGCMVPYSGLHHLLFSYLKSPFLIMTSANIPGYPMITTLSQAIKKLDQVVDLYLDHDREIINRCDDSVIRKGCIIRLSRGFAPKRTKINLGEKTILGTGPELNSTVSLYNNGFCITSPHIGNVRNPGTYGYLQETVRCLLDLMKPDIKIIAHDLHPQFLSTRYAKELAEEAGAEIIPVQHHIAHIAATCQQECIGIALDGVGYGSDGTVWGGEIFRGKTPEFSRIGHLTPVLMPGGDLATVWPERMLYGILPDGETLEILAERGWKEDELSILEKQVSKRFNTTVTTSTGRVLDAVSALLNICRKKTYDGEPAMRLESAAYGTNPEKWEIPVNSSDGTMILDTVSLLKTARIKYLKNPDNNDNIRRIAASFQYNLARGVAMIACDSALSLDISRIALSGGVSYNEIIRETIRNEVNDKGFEFVINYDLPQGDGCISFGQCVFGSGI